jgi:hypothetical protein
MGRGSLGFFPELRTPPLPATHIRAGDRPWTLARNYTFDISRTSNRCVHSSRATSCRTEPAFPIGTLFAQHRLAIQRRPACCLPHRLLTRHSTSPRYGSSRDPRHRRGVEQSPATISSCFAYPHRFQDPMCHTPHAPTEVARLGLTAPAACTPSGGCDDEHPQADSGGRV